VHSGTDRNAHFFKPDKRDLHPEESESQPNVAARIRNAMVLPVTLSPNIEARWL
jgi:hypothetical protein